MPTVESLQALVVSFAEARNWQRFHDPKNLTMALASEVGEIADILRWVDNTDSDAVLRDSAVGQRFRHEVADAMILLLLLCDRTGVNLTAAVEEKLSINATNYPVEDSRDFAERPRAGDTTARTGQLPV